MTRAPKPHARICSVLIHPRRTERPHPLPRPGTFADRDPLAGNAKETLSRLKAPTTLRTFTAAEGAGGHQETLNRALAETRILDWLDETLS
jgi:hypothetical protein